MRRPPFHPQVQALHDAVDLPSLTPQTLDGLRRRNAGDPADLEREGLQRRELRATAPDGADIPLTAWRTPGTSGGPAYVFLHGGGLVSGDRYACGDVAPHLREHGGVAVSVGYRLAPDINPDTPVEDCLAAVSWVLEHADELDHDGRVVLAGTSAGGGLAAGVLLALRDRQQATVTGAWLNTPMLDDTTSSMSARQFERLGLLWNGESNRTAWAMVLGETTTPTVYVAPARATDLTGLPPLLVTVGSAEPLRDEAVAFASRVWADGGDCELHVYAGGSHCFDDVLPDASISRAQDDAVRAWMRALLDPDDAADAADAITEAKQMERCYR